MTISPTDSQPTTDHGRRGSMKLLVAGLIAVPAIAAGWWVLAPKGDAALADAADPAKRTWDETDFARFAALLPLEQLQLLRVSLGLAKAGEAVPVSVDRAAWIKEITAQAVWASSNILIYPFKDFRYDKMARWVGTQYEVASAVIEGESTFKVEQAIQMQLFVGIWDKLTPEQRLKTLEQMDPDGKLTDPAAIALMTGTAAAGAIAGAALLSGFAFYTTMSSFICAAGGLLGLTFPFAVYTGASTAVAFLATNPIGWAILGLGAVASLAWLGGANEQKSAAFVCQVNALRAAAWMGAGRKLP
jgi:hypothetical protein